MNFKRYHVSKNLAWTGWAQDFVDRIDDSSKAYIIDSDMLYFTAAAGYNEQDTKFLFKIDWKEKTRYTISLNYQRSSSESSSSMTQIVYTDGTTKRFPNYVNDGMWHYQEVVSDMDKTIKYIGIYWSSGNLKIDINTFMVNEGTSALPYEPYGDSWHDIPHYIHNTATDTITTLPADIYANDATATVGLKGNMEQSGTPTPTTPIQPSECGERTENLCPSTGWEAGQYANGVWDTITPNRLTSPFFAIDEGKQYTIKINSGTKLAWINLNYFDSNKQWLGNRSTLGMAQFSATSQSETTPNMPTGSAYMRVTVRPYNDVGNITVNDIPTSDIAANEGSTALPYEPYGYKIPILNNSQTTNVYLGEVQTERNITKAVITGSDLNAFTTSDGMSIMRTRIVDLLSANIRYNNYLCSHFENVAYADRGANKTWNLAGNYYNVHFALSASDYDTEAKFREFFNTNPVTIWYVLSKPTTGIVNEPLRKIGDYADTVSGITIPTIAGANTLSIDTTLQPSEVTVNYKGWHPLSAVHERENGAWT